MWLGTQCCPGCALLAIQSLASYALHLFELEIIIQKFELPHRSTLRCVVSMHAMLPGPAKSCHHSSWSTLAILIPFRLHADTNRLVTSRPGGDPGLQLYCLLVVNKTYTA